MNNNNFTSNPCGGTIPEQGEAVNLTKETDVNEILSSVESINLSTITNYVCEIKIEENWLRKFYYDLLGHKPMQVVMKPIELGYINGSWFFCLQKIIDYFSNNRNPNNLTYVLHINDDTKKDRIGVELTVIGDADIFDSMQGKYIYYDDSEGKWWNEQAYYRIEEYVRDRINASSLGKYSWEYFKELSIKYTDEIIKNKIDKAVKKSKYFCRIWKYESGSYFSMSLLTDLLSKGNTAFVQERGNRAYSIILYWGNNKLIDKGKIYVTSYWSFHDIIDNPRQVIDVKDLYLMLKKEGVLI